MDRARTAIWGIGVEREDRATFEWVHTAYASGEAAERFDNGVRRRSICGVAGAASRKCNLHGHDFRGGELQRRHDNHKQHKS
jgi:hypothetical protein